MQITIDTDHPQDVQLLAALVGALTNGGPEDPKTTNTVAKSKPTPTPDPVQEPEPTPEPAAAPSSGATMKDAVALATDLVAKGRAKDVKAALADAGASRVTELADDAIAGFIAALS